MLAQMNSANIWWSGWTYTTVAEGTWVYSTAALPCTWMTHVTATHDQVQVEQHGAQDPARHREHIPVGPRVRITYIVVRSNRLAALHRRRNWLMDEEIRD